MANAPDRRPAGGSQSDVFLALEGARGTIKGESLAIDHAGQIIVHSWRWAIKSEGDPGPPSLRSLNARRSYSALTVVKSIDLATTALMSALAKGEELGQAKLTMRKAGGGQFDYLTITLTNVWIQDLEHVVDMQGNTFETVTFAFSKVDVEYRIQRGSGHGGATSTFTDNPGYPV